MVALYWDADGFDHWLAHLEDGTWMKFPAQVNGWTRRSRAQGLDPAMLRRVPGCRAFNTGFPNTDEIEVKQFKVIPKVA